MSLPEEQWKPLDGDETLGLVSNLGRVKSAYGLVLKQKTKKNGYKEIHIMQRGRGFSKHYLVHRLVAKAFCDGFADGLNVNHKDGDKANNVADNLEWVTPKENIRHAFKIGLRKLVGKKPIIPHEHRLMLMLERANGTTVKELADRYGVHHTSMSNYLNGRKRKPYCFEVAA